MKFCLIWEQAILAMLTVALYFLYLGERSKSRLCARARGPCCSRAALGQWFPKWDVCDEPLGCQKEVIHIFIILKNVLLGVFVLFCFVFGHAARLVGS